MVQMNKYNAINSIKNNCLAEPHEAPGKGLTEANKEKDQNKRDIKKGGGGGGGGEIASPVLEGKHAVRPRKPAILNLGQKVLDPSIEKQLISKAKQTFTCKRTRRKDRFTD